MPLVFCGSCPGQDTDKMIIGGQLHDTPKPPVEQIFKIRCLRWLLKEVNLVSFLKSLCSRLCSEQFLSKVKFFVRHSRLCTAGVGVSNNHYNSLFQTKFCLGLQPNLLSDWCVQMSSMNVCQPKIKMIQTCN